MWLNWFHVDRVRHRPSRFARRGAFRWGGSLGGRAMAWQIKRHSTCTVGKNTRPAMHADGGDLQLWNTCGQFSGLHWMLPCRRPGDRKRCEMGLGITLAVSLARERKRAADARPLIADSKGLPAIEPKHQALSTFGVRSAADGRLPQRSSMTGTSRNAPCRGLASQSLPSGHQQATLEKSAAVSSNA